MQADDPVEAQSAMLIKICGAVGEGGLISSNQKQMLQLRGKLVCVAFDISSVLFFTLCLPVLFLVFLTWRPAQVTVDNNKTAVTGKRASLSCSYALPEKVQQITWKHSSAPGQSTEVASYAKRSDPMIEPPYQGRVWLSASLSNSQLTIQPVTIQDEGCYTCLYSTHAEGQKSSTVCLATYGKHLFPWVSIIIVL